MQQITIHATTLTKMNKNHGKVESPSPLTTAEANYYGYEQPVETLTPGRRCQRRFSMSSIDIEPMNTNDSNNKTDQLRSLKPHQATSVFLQHLQSMTTNSSGNEKPKGHCSISPKKPMSFKQNHDDSAVPSESQPPNRRRFQRRSSLTAIETSPGINNLGSDKSNKQRSPKRNEGSNDCPARPNLRRGMSSASSSSSKDESSQGHASSKSDGMQQVNCNFSPYPQKKPSSYIQKNDVSPLSEESPAPTRRRVQRRSSMTVIETSTGYNDACLNNNEQPQRSPQGFKKRCEASQGLLDVEVHSKPKLKRDISASSAKTDKSSQNSSSSEKRSLQQRHQTSPSDSANKLSSFIEKDDDIMDHDDSVLHSLLPLVSPVPIRRGVQRRASLSAMPKIAYNSISKSSNRRRSRSPIQRSEASLDVETHAKPTLNRAVSTSSCKTEHSQDSSSSESKPRHRRISPRPSKKQSSSTRKLDVGVSPAESSDLSKRKSKRHLIKSEEIAKKALMRELHSRSLTKKGTPLSPKPRLARDSSSSSSKRELGQKRRSRQSPRPATKPSSVNKKLDIDSLPLESSVSRNQASQNQSLKSEEAARCAVLRELHSKSAPKKGHTLVSPHSPMKQLSSSKKHDASLHTVESVDSKNQMSKTQSLKNQEAARQLVMSELHSRSATKSDVQMPELSRNSSSSSENKGQQHRRHRVSPQPPKKHSSFKHKHEPSLHSVEPSDSRNQTNKPQSFKSQEDAKMLVMRELDSWSDSKKVVTSTPKPKLDRNSSSASGKKNMQQRRSRVSSHHPKKQLSSSKERDIIPHAVDSSDNKSTPQASKHQEEAKQLVMHELHSRTSTKKTTTSSYSMKSGTSKAPATSGNKVPQGYQHHHHPTGSITDAKAKNTKSSSSTRHAPTINSNKKQDRQQSTPPPRSEIYLQVRFVSPSGKNASTLASKSPTTVVNTSDFCLSSSPNTERKESHHPRLVVDWFFRPSDVTDATSPPQNKRDGKPREVDAFEVCKPSLPKKDAIQETIESRKEAARAKKLNSLKFIQKMSNPLSFRKGDGKGKGNSNNKQSKGGYQMQMSSSMSVFTEDGEHSVITWSRS